MIRCKFLDRVIDYYFIVEKIGSPIDKHPLKQDCKGPNEIRVRCGVFCPATCSGSEAAQQCLAVSLYKI